MRKIIAFTLFCIQGIVGQQQVAQLDIEYKSTDYNFGQCFFLSNPSNNELIFFIEDLYKSDIYLLDKNFNTLKHLKIKEFPISFQKFIGYQILSNSTYNLFFSNNSYKKFGVVKIDFEKENVTTSPLEFSLKKERYVKSISSNGKFYLLSVIKRSSDVNLYVFDKEMNTKKKTFDFSFLNKNSSNGFLSKAADQLSPYALQKMESNLTNSIEIASENFKFYDFDNKFVITFDIDKTLTKVVAINSKSLELETQDILKPETQGDITVAHNSYLYNNKLFQILVNKKELKLRIHDLDKQQILKDFTVKKEDSIPFKNSLFLERGSFNSRTKADDIKNTAVFLKRILQGDLGIVATKKMNTYYIEIGSKVEYNYGGGMMMTSGSGFGAGGAAPMVMHYPGFSSSNLIRIEGLFDNKFNPVEGETSKNFNDKIYDFIKKLRKEKVDLVTSNPSEHQTVSIKKTKPKLTTIFFHENRMLYGFFDPKNRKYHIIDFSD